MKNQLKQVEDFQIKCEQIVSYKPSVLDEDIARFRAKLMIEESGEYLDAVRDNNIYEIADALADQLYVLLGTINAHGLQDAIKEIFDEVHNSNMTKLDENGNVVWIDYNGHKKVGKSALYQKPDIKGVLDKWL